MHACMHTPLQVDIYSAGVLLLEMFHPFATQMERFHVLTALQRHVLPQAMVGTPQGPCHPPCHLTMFHPPRRRPDPSPTLGELILAMTHESSAARPSVEALLASPLLATHGHISVSVRRSERYALMPPIAEACAYMRMPTYLHAHAHAQHGHAYMHMHLATCTCTGTRSCRRLPRPSRRSCASLRSPRVTSLPHCPLLPRPPQHRLAAPLPPPLLATRAAW